MHLLTGLNVLESHLCRKSKPGGWRHGGAFMASIAGRNLPEIGGFWNKESSRGILRRVDRFGQDIFTITLPGFKMANL